MSRQQQLGNRVNLCLNLLLSTQVLLNTRVKSFSVTYFEGLGRYDFLALLAEFSLPLLNLVKSLKEHLGVRVQFELKEGIVLIACCHLESFHFVDWYVVLNLHAILDHLLGVIINLGFHAVDLAVHGLYLLKVPQQLGDPPVLVVFLLRGREVVIGEFLA